MNSQSHILTRREALLSGIKGTVAVSLALPLISKASEPPPSSPEREFVPENDYPFFGYHPATTPPFIETVK